MPDDPNATGSGGKGSQGDGGSGEGAGAGGGAKGGQADPGKQTPEGDKGTQQGSSGSGSDQYITPERLTSVLDARQRKQEAEFKKFSAGQDELRQQIATLTEALSKKEPGKTGDGSGGKKEPESQELIELRRKVDELTKTAETSKNRAEEEARLRRDGEFKSAVTSALQAAGCEKVEEAFLVIKPRLVHTEDGRIFATVKTEYGEEDVDLKTYIEKHFAEDILPHVFKGRMRAGSPASGDGGAGGGGYKFTKEQAFDPKFYAEHTEEVRAAVEAGLVKGVPKPGG